MEQEQMISTVESNLSSFKLRVDNQPNLRFTGECIAKAESSEEKSSGSSYSGSIGRSTDLALYKTKGGQFVCHCIEHTRWEGERTSYSLRVCTTEEEVFDFFGFGWLAQELYDKAGLDQSIEIE